MIKTIMDLLDKEFDYEKTFPPLGHSEHHFNKYLNHPWLKTREGIEDWLIEYGKDWSGNKYNIHEDLTVSTNDPGDFIYIVKKGEVEIDYLPIKFRKTQSFYCQNLGLKSLIGVPYNCYSLYADNNSIKSLKGISKKITNFLILSDNCLNNFSHMNECENNYEMFFVDKNPINSWDGFTSAKALSWWEDKKISEKGYELLLQAPDSLFSIIMFRGQKDKRIKFNNDGTDILFIDMDWLHKEQKRIKDIKSIERDIEISVKLENTDNKKRKL